MKKDYEKEFLEIDTAATSVATLLKQAFHNTGNTTYTDALLIYANNCEPTDLYIIDCVARIAKHRRVNEVSLPGESHELQRPQVPVPSPRVKYRGLDLNARHNLLKDALGEMYNRKLFTTKNHWIGTFLVIRDRLERTGFSQANFPEFAILITPDVFPPKLHISGSTMKNFTKIITDPSDRLEAYYDMENNPQEDFCEELWNVIQRML